MSEHDQLEDNYEYDQPWSPVSYFEEENEATGGKPTGSAYSPSKLASLFETNRLAVDQDLAMRKRLNSFSNEDDSSTRNEYENTDLDSLSQYTLEVDNGIKILDTTPAINRKAIFHDLDRLRRWKESADNPNKEVYVSDDDNGDNTETGNYCLSVPNSIPTNTSISDSDNKIDIDMDYILNSLPDVASFDNSITSVNCYGKLNQLERQINIKDSLFTIGTTTTTQFIPTSGLSSIVEKKNNSLEDDSEMIINKIIMKDGMNEEMNNISDLNRKNSVIGTVDDVNETDMPAESKDETVSSSIRESLRGIDISDELDSLFDDIDEGLELPDVPDHEICNFQDSGSSNIVRSCSNIESRTGDELCNVTDAIVDNTTLPPCVDQHDANVSSEYINAGPGVDCIDIDNSSTSLENMTDSEHSEDHLTVQHIIDSNDTDSMDAFIDYVDTVTNSELTVGDSVCTNATVSTTYEIQSRLDINVDSAIGPESSLNFSTRSSALIEDVLNHIQSSEFRHGNEHPEFLEHHHLPDITETNSECDGIDGQFEDVTMNSSEKLKDDPHIDDYHSSEKESPNVSGTLSLNVDDAVEVGTRSLTLIDNHDVNDTCKDVSNLDSVDSVHSTWSEDTTHTDYSDTDATAIEGISIPIPENVNVSSVLHRDSIVCLTPDDGEDLMALSGGGIGVNGTDSFVDNQQPSTSRCGMNENQYSDSEDEVDAGQGEQVVALEDPSASDHFCKTHANPSADIDNDAVASVCPPEDVTGDQVEDGQESTDSDGTDNISPADISTEMTEVCVVDTSTDIEISTQCDSDIGRLSIGGDSKETEIDRECELVAATSSITPQSSVGEPEVSSITSDIPLPPQSVESIREVSVVAVATSAEVSGISDAVFETPDSSAEAASTFTAVVSSSTDSGQIPRTSSSSTRSSGSVRRVRFSLDSEENMDSRDVPSTPGSFLEQQTPSATTSDESTSAPVGVDHSSDMRTLGWVAPKWIPDSEAKGCMKCNMKFTVVKRRHHCRACGKVLCSQCCNMKFHLPYMDYKPVRVCQSCCDIMINALNGSSSIDQPPPAPPQRHQLQQQHQPQQPPPQLLQPQQQQQPHLPGDTQPFPPPEAPPPYSETVEAHTDRISSSSSIAPPYSESAAAGIASGLTAARFGEEHPAEVMSAGAAMDTVPALRPLPNQTPNQTINDMMSFQLPGYSSHTRGGVRNSRNRSESEMSAVIMFNSTVTNLPPILRRDNEETRIVNNPDLNILLKQMNDENEDPITFIVNKNLVVRVKVVDLSCCVEKKSWCFVSDGMGASNQEEIVILIKCGSYDIDEISVLRKVLQQMNAIFEKAKHGNAVSDSEQMEFNENLRCMSKNVGMLFYKPTLQCVKKLFLPTSPYLFGMYIERSEVAWAKNFPLRLLLRIGAEFKYYPCPLFNVLDRAPVYEGVGRTILDLLADFRNFQYTLPRIVGVTINLRGKDTIIKLPRHRFDEVLKAVNGAEENVFSLAGNFSPTCDGHLVSVEKEGRYKTQTLSIVLKENRKVTCASFFVMSAALKPDQSGVKAKASIVEDGVMVQVTSEVIQEFKQAIKDMKEYTINAGDPAAEECSQVGIEWCSADSMDRPKLTSPIDATPFDNLTNMKIRHSYDYTANNLTAKIHWVEVYFLPQDNDTTVQRLSARELGQMTSSIAKACMSALSPHLMTLIALEMTRIGLRVNLAANFVEYKIGANLTTLPSELLPTLDDKLVPAVHNVMSSAQERVAVELIFQLVKIV